MAGKMNVNIYKVLETAGAPPLDHLLEQVEGLDLGSRLRRVGDFDMRLEHIARPHSAGNTSDFWMMDFVKLRYEHGPGKAGRGTPIQGFDMDDDQGFGEETAALYDPATKYLVLQYNHNGVREGKIKEYFSQLVHDPENIAHYQFRVKLDESSEVKLAKKQYIAKVHFKIDSSKISAAYRQADVSLERALELSDQQDGQILELTISASRGKNLKQGAVTSLINALRGVRKDDISNDTGGLREFEIFGREDEHSRAEAINMLAPKMQVTIGELSLGSDRRYTLLSRWIGLQRARRGWDRVIGE